MANTQPTQPTGASLGDAPAEKEPQDIHRMVDLLRDAVRPYPPAALFALYDNGHTTLFEQLVACIVSVRTLDEVMLGTARRLFAVARTPADVARLGLDELDALIHASSFHRNKAANILEISRRAITEHGGALPCEEAALLALPGVGPKCAHLALGIACGQEHIAVDIHVHRVTNRWGYVAAATPEATMAALEAVLPREHWVGINRLLVPFGKHICTGKRPRCSVCPVVSMCRQVGVTEHR